MSEKLNQNWKEKGNRYVFASPRRIETSYRGTERKKQELISSMKVEASSKDTWSSGYVLPPPICRAWGTLLRLPENYIAFSPFDTPRNIFRS